MNIKLSHILPLALTLLVGGSRPGEWCTFAALLRVGS